MTPEQFVYWMQGFAELNEAPPSPEQWRSIREHLALVFEKKTAHVISKADIDHLAGLKMDLARDQAKFIEKLGASKLQC